MYFLLAIWLVASWFSGEVTGYPQKRPLIQNTTIFLACVAAGPRTRLPLYRRFRVSATQAKFSQSKRYSLNLKPPLLVSYYHHFLRWRSNNFLPDTMVRSLCTTLLKAWEELLETTWIYIYLNLKIACNPTLVSDHLRLPSAEATAGYPLVCYTAVFSVVTQRSSAALSDDSKKRLCSRLGIPIKIAIIEKIESARGTVERGKGP